MNDISQLESQLTQHPELSPVRYYIPAMLLQFELRFVEHCCKALSAEKCRSFVPMLLPVDSSDLYTYCPLDPRQETYDLSCPLLVFIPFKDLYRPWEIAFRVAHEIAHYCEDHSRRRIERHNMLIKCAAMFIVKCWYTQYIILSVGDSDDHLYLKSIEYATALTEQFVTNINLDYPDEKWYLSQSLNALSREAMDVIFSQKYLEQYLFKIDSDYFFNKQRDYSKIRRNAQHPTKCIWMQHAYEDYLDLLKFLCAECYADIAMVLLTNCEFHDYFSSVYLDEYLRFVEQQRDTELLLGDPLVMRQVVRMALVIQAINKSDEFQETWNPEKIEISQENLIPMLQCSLAIIRQGADNSDVEVLPKVNVLTPYIPSIDDFKSIGKYLAECAKVITHDLKESDPERYKSVQLVRDGIKYVKNGAFHWNKLQKYLFE